MLVSPGRTRSWFSRVTSGFGRQRFLVSDTFGLNFVTLTFFTVNGHLVPGIAGTGSKKAEAKADAVRQMQERGDIIVSCFIRWLVVQGVNE